VFRPLWTVRGSFQIEIPGDSRRPHGVDVCGGFLRPFNTPGTAQQVFLKRGKLGFVYYHSKVVALEIVIRNMLQVS
jgi:hypothetical protein